MGKTLILRLSSLGDVIMASAALEVARSQGTHVDWIVAREFSSVLRGHSALDKLWEFDRKTGLTGWIKICRHVQAACRSGEYARVIDLHRTLRSAILLTMLRLSGAAKNVEIVRVRKARWRLYGFFLLKGLWPKALRPVPWVRKYAEALGGTGEERPDLRHLLATRPTDHGAPLSASPFFPDPASGYFCVMPSSKWNGKKWPVRHFAEFLAKLGRLSVVLGGPDDQESRALVKVLEASGVPVMSGVGKWSLPQVAQVLARSQGYIGNDTGLGHLAEAVGVPAIFVFGPTVPEMGFGPWRTESRAVGKDLWCRPCGKDGRFCFRVTRRYECMKGLSASEALEKAPSWMSERAQTKSEGMIR